ncbi:MAG: aldo/keto reductase [Gammaproteobacteria bacterium]
MTDPESPARRRFLRRSAASGAVAALAPGLLPVAGPAAEPAVRGYRTLGRTGLRISDISFGASRLRAGEEDLVRHALDRGINYFDSAYGYTGGDSEEVLGQVLGPVRDRVVLVSKVESTADWPREQMMVQLEASLERLRTDYIDIYLCHAVNDVERLKSQEWQEFVARAKQQGKIRFSGMSGHAGKLIECLDYALDRDMADVILCAYNFGQDPKFYEQFTRSFNYVANQPDLPRVLAKAKAKNVGVVAMKTLMGARLNDMRPFESAGGTFAQAAFRWVLSNPDVDALIISMTSREKIDEFLGASGAHALAAGDLDLLQQYAALNGMTYCRHACNDCAGACPYGVQISDVLRTRMYATDYEDLPFAREEYAQITTDAAACLACTGKPCRDACTHGIAIADLCAPTHRMLA